MQVIVCHFWTFPWKLTRPFGLTVWKNEKFTYSHRKYISSTSYQLFSNFSSVETLLSRNFCQKSVQVNFLYIHNLHTTGGLLLILNFRSELASLFDTAVFENISWNWNWFTGVQNKCHFGQQYLVQHHNVEKKWIIYSHRKFFPSNQLFDKFSRNAILTIFLPKSRICESKFL